MFTFKVRIWQYNNPKQATTVTIEAHNEITAKVMALTQNRDYNAALVLCGGM